MNISDAAREAVYPICDIFDAFYRQNRVKVEEAVQTAIDSATAALTLERDQLRQQLAEAREDSKRLDKLEQSQRSVRALPTWSGAWWIVQEGTGTAKAHNLRDAIDRLQDPQPAH